MAPAPDKHESAKQRWDALPDDAPRDVWFDALRAAIAEFYLAEPGNPYRQSGRSRGARRWEETRRCLVEVVHRDGDFMDVGCANGLLLESLVGWAGERGIRLRPHGIDFVPELVALARERHPDHAGSFEVANAFEWKPMRRYDFVRVGVECVPAADRTAFISRQHDLAVAPGGRLIVCNYRSPDEPAIEPELVLEDAGLDVVGRTSAPGVLVAWCDRSDAPVLRPAGADDSEFAYVTKRAAFRVYVEKVWGWDEAEQRRLHEQRFAVGGMHVIVVSGEEVGILAVVRDPDAVVVKQLFILPDHQSRGTGEACMRHVMDEAAAAGLPVRLRTLKVDPRAIDFYRRLGFGMVGEDESHVYLEWVGAPR